VPPSVGRNGTTKTSTAVLTFPAVTKYLKPGFRATKVYITSDIGGLKYPPEMKDDMWNEKCEICGRVWGEHSQEEYENCFDEIVRKAS